MLGTDMPKALSRMQLPSPVLDTLLGRNGIYMPFLQLAGALEAQSKLGLQEAAAELHLTAEQINRAHLDALRFAGTLQFS
jgi:EAL and modified HD-GYP domain-containing signal transduction protein